MSTKECPFCFEQIDQRASRCPKCRGDVAKHEMYHKPMSCGQVIFWLLAVLVGVGLWVAYHLSMNTPLP
jgi:hypothetical protein